MCWIIKLQFKGHLSRGTAEKDIGWWCHPPSDPQNHLFLYTIIYLKIYLGQNIHFFPPLVLFYVHRNEDTTQFPSLGGSSASSSLQSQWGGTPKPRGCNVMLCASNPLASLHDRVSRVTNRSETGDPSTLKTSPQHLFIRQRGFYFERTRSPNIRSPPV